jgi:hypothetical protein
LTANTTTLQEEFLISIEERESSRSFRKLENWCLMGNGHKMVLPLLLKEKPSHRIHVKFTNNQQISWNLKAM